MTTAVDGAAPAARPWIVNALIILIIPQLVVILGLFPYRAFTEGGIQLQVLSVGLAAFTLLTLAGLWMARPWAIWATLVVLSFAAVLALQAWTTGYRPELAIISGGLIVASVVLLFALATPTGPRIVIYQRILYAFVLAGAGWVAAWCLLAPALADSAMPFPVPPLHARFFGAVYLAGAVYMVLTFFAQRWSEVRVVSLVLAVWSGMLGVVTLLNLAAFDWSWIPVWFWFVAYTNFPLVGWFVVWSQRSDRTEGDGPAISGLLRSWLILQGIVFTVLAIGLLAAPVFMATLWPWPLPLVVAQLYSAPILGFGLGSLYAASRGIWSEARMVVVSTFVFAATALTGSALHSGLFDMQAPSAWVWFGGFALVALATLLFSAVPSLRTRS